MGAKWWSKVSDIAKTVRGLAPVLPIGAKAKKIIETAGKVEDVIEESLRKAPAPTATPPTP